MRADEILTAFLELESAIGKQKPRAGSPARGFEVLFFLFSALADLSAGDCPTEFSQLGGVGDLRDGPFVHPKLRESLDILPGNLSSIFYLPIFGTTRRRFALCLFEIALVLVRSITLPASS